MLTWDEAKRQRNLEKHGLDFSDAGLVLTNHYRMEVESIRQGEIRRQTFAYVAGLGPRCQTTEHQLSPRKS